MATIKSYTDIEQSKKLVEILPTESADMVYVYTIDLEGDEHYDIDFRNNYPLFEDGICAWSLASLLEQIPYKLCDDAGNLMYLQINKEDNGYQLAYTDPYGDFGDTETDIYKDFVDACYEMILKLNEQNLL